MTAAPSQFVPLSRLLSSSRDAGTPVAEHGGRIIDLVGFRADVAANCAALRRRKCTRGALVTTDAYPGAVGFFALLAAGAEVIVPPNANPATLAMLAGTWDVVLSDTPLGSVEGVLPIETGHSEGGKFDGHLDPNAPVTFFTSGTTGTPKRIAKRLGHLEHEASAIERLLSTFVPANARVLATVPHQHVYGMSFRLAWPLSTGRCFVSNMHDLLDSALLQLNPETALITSPAHLNRLDGYAALAPDAQPCLVLSAGAPLPDAAAARALQVFGVPVTEIFGSTETGAFASRRRTHANPAWRPLPGVSVTATPDGLLSVDAPYVPDAPFLGADRVEIDADGGIQFGGRTDAIVKIEGKRLSLVDIERQLCALDQVADAAVLGIGVDISQLAAVVVPSALGVRELAETGAFRFGRSLKRALAETQDAEGQPRRWRFVEALPLGALGKRNTAQLAALFQKDDVTADQQPRPLEPDVRGVRQIPDGVELDLFVPADLAYLEGHFPEHPIVAGVVQLDWVVVLAERYLRVPLQTAPKFSVKYRRLTQPEDTLLLTMRLQSNATRLTFEYRNRQEISSSGSIALDAIANLPHQTSPAKDT